MINKEQHLNEFLAICQAMYERMERDGTWPWPSINNKEDNSGTTAPTIK